MPYNRSTKSAPAKVPAKSPKSHGPVPAKQDSYKGSKGSKRMSY